MHFLSSNAGFAPTILRITTGLILFLHGFPKLMALGNFVGTVGNMVPEPLNWPVAIITVLIEVIGGVLLIVGLQTRVIAFFSGIWFFGIAFVVHTSEFYQVFNIMDSRGQSGFEFPFLIAVVLIAISFLGSGKLAVRHE